MDILFRRGSASAAEVRQDMPDPPSYSAVRAQLRILEEKGHITHEQNGPRYVYRPALAKERAKTTALRHLVQTFFNGSAEQTMAALLDDDTSKLTQAELDRLSDLIDGARHDVSPEDNS
jgi:predicted transcriptional regulator